MIYFIQDGNDGPIKIGTTTNLRVRLNQLAIEHGGALKVRGVIAELGRLDEQALHGMFAALRVSGEWFAPHPSLLTYIRDNTTIWGGENDKELLNVRISPTTLRDLQIGAAYREMDLSDYVDQILADVARQGVNEEHRLYCERKGLAR